MNINFSGLHINKTKENEAALMHYAKKGKEVRRAMAESFRAVDELSKDGEVYLDINQKMKNVHDFKITDENGNLISKTTIIHPCPHQLTIDECIREINKIPNHFQKGFQDRIMHDEAAFVNSILDKYV